MRPLVKLNSPLPQEVYPRLKAPLAKAFPFSCLKKNGIAVWPRMSYFISLCLIYKMRLISTPASWELCEHSVNEHMQSPQNAAWHMQSTEWFAVGIMLKEHQRARETVASSLGWKECGKLQSSSAKQERGKEANGAKKKTLLSASVKNLLQVLAHTSSFLSVSG